MRINLQPWSSGFDHLADEMLSMLNEMQGRNYFRSQASGVWKPRVNLYETPKKLFVCVELAGTKPGQIDVRVERGVLVVQGLRGKPEFPLERGKDACPDEISVHAMEIDWGRFLRKIRIPGDVEVGNISATYLEGYLWIVLPRSSDRTEPPRHG